MPSNTDRYRTFVGTFFTIVTLIIVLSYATYKFNDLLNQSDYQLRSENQEHYFAVNEPFSVENGFQVAAGIIQVDGYPSNPSIEDPEIGMLKMYIKSWDNFDKETNGAISFTEVKSEFC